MKKLEIRRLKGSRIPIQLVITDETGEVVPGQTKVSVVSQVGDMTKVSVEFFVVEDDRRAGIAMCVDKESL